MHKAFFRIAALFERFATILRWLEFRAKILASISREKGYILESRQPDISWRPDGLPKDEIINKL